MKNKIIFFVLPCSLISISCSQTSVFDRINMSYPGMSVTSKSGIDGNVVRSYKLIPEGIDSYAEQKLTGITVTVDKDGSLARVDPIRYKVELITLDTVIKKLKSTNSVKEIFRIARYHELTELQRLALLRKIAIAIIARDENLEITIEQDEKKLIQESLKNFNISIKDNPSTQELLSIAKLILNKVSIEDGQ